MCDFQIWSTSGYTQVSKEGGRYFLGTRISILFYFGNVQCYHQNKTQYFEFYSCFFALNSKQLVREMVTSGVIPCQRCQCLSCLSCADSFKRCMHLKVLLLTLLPTVQILTKESIIFKCLTCYCYCIIFEKMDCPWEMEQSLFLLYLIMQQLRQHAKLPINKLLGPIL